MTRIGEKRASLTWILGPIMVYLLGGLVSALVAGILGDVWLLALYVSGAATALLAWRWLRWPDIWARYFSFGAVLLLMCVLNRVFYVADYFMNGARFGEWPFFVQAPQVAVFKGEVMTVLGTLITVFAWRLAGGMRVSPAVVFEQPQAAYRVLLVVYLMSLVGLTMSQIEPTVAATLGQLLPTLLGLGLVSAFLLSLTKFRHGLVRLVSVAGLSVPFLITASGTGMKQNMILAVLPTALLAWRYFRHPVLRMGMVLAGGFALGLITSYVNSFRAEVWDQGNGSNSGQTLRYFVDEMQNDGFLNTVGNGLKDFVSRADASYEHGWAVSIADEQQFHPRLVFSPLAYAFIPRFLWPGKPEIRQGWEYSGLVFGQQYIAWSSSSTEAGLYPSLYLGFGWPAVVIGAILVGVLLAGMTRLAQRFGGPIAAGLYIFAMLPFILRLDETWAVGALTGPVISLVYLLVIVGLARLFAMVTIHSRSSIANIR